jgi:hypothetical protein
MRFGVTWIDAAALSIPDCTMQKQMAIKIKKMISFIVILRIQILF